MILEILCIWTIFPQQICALSFTNPELTPPTMLERYAEIKIGV